MTTGRCAKKHAVKLYFKPGLYRDNDENWKNPIASMPEFDE